MSYRPWHEGRESEGYPGARMAGEGGSGLRRGLMALELLAEADGLTRPGWVSWTSHGGWGSTRARRRARCARSTTPASPSATSRRARTASDGGCSRYAARVGDRRLLRAAPPVLHELVAALGETAHLSCRDGTSVLTLLSQSPPSVCGRASGPGGPCPRTARPPAGAPADHGAAALRALLGDGDLLARRARAPRDIDALANADRRGRARRLRRADDELEPGLAGVAAPVRDFRGRIVAALNVSAPSFRLGRTSEARRDVGRAAARLADELCADRLVRTQQPKGNLLTDDADCSNGSTQGPVICAEGYLFELERRGYLQAGAFVPEVVLEHPEMVAAAAPRVRACGLGRRRGVHLLRPPREAADHRQGARCSRRSTARRCASPRDVARETGALLAGDVCNTNVFDRRRGSRRDACARCSRSRSAGRSTPASTSSSARRSRGRRRR